jgi:hypothetical protein
LEKGKKKLCSPIKFNSIQKDALSTPQIKTCKQLFTKNGSQASLSSITDKSDLNKDAELIGFCFPVYAFAIPRICRKYLLNLPKIKKPLKAFVLITAGDFQEAGFSVNESTTLLKKK